MKDELVYNERQQWAKALYLKDDKNVKDISLEVGATEADVRNWIKEGAWDGMRRSMLISKKAQLEHYYNVLEQMKDKDGTTPKDVDLIVKYTAAIKNLEADITVSGIIEVAEPFIQWLRHKDLPLTKKVILQFDAFIKQKLAA